MLRRHRDIVEGDYQRSPELDWLFTWELLDEIWHLDMDAEERVYGSISRHRSFGISETEAMKKSTGSDAVNAAVIEQTRHWADLTIERFAL